MRCMTILHNITRYDFNFGLYILSLKSTINFFGSFGKENKVYNFFKISLFKQKKFTNITLIVSKVHQNTKYAVFGMELYHQQHATFILEKSTMRSWYLPKLTLKFVKKKPTPSSSFTTATEFF